MGNENIANQIEQNLENLKNLELNKLESVNFQPWNNLNKEDFFNSIQEIIDVLESSLNLSVYEHYPFNIINAIRNNLNNVIQKTQQVINQTSQPNFQRAFQQAESYRTSLRQWGVYSYVNYEYNIEEKIKSFDSDYQDVLKNKREVEELKKNVRQLIEPAVSGSLSKSFSERKKELINNRNRWLYISIVSAICGVCATIWVVISLVKALDIPENATQEQIKTIIENQPNYELINFLRIAILLPIYSFFYHSFSQYKNERSLEEEYSHRAAVATSLPNYGDLAVDTKVKDQIISGASNVVFRSPIEKNGSVNTSDEDTFSKIKELIDSIDQLVSKRDQ